MVSFKKKSDLGWYFYRLRMDYEFDKKIKWWIDIFIIDQIFRKINYGNGIGYNYSLWRFHRRAAKDKAGHQVSFCCYTTLKDSKLIEKALTGTNAFKLLSESGLLKEYFREKGGDDIAGSSDGNWSWKIQKSWPYFAKGASESILELIRLITEQTYKPNNFKSMIDAQDCYEKVSEELKLIWYNEGGHAFFHHLNALFGYELTKTKQTIITSF